MDKKELKLTFIESADVGRKEYYTAIEVTSPLTQCLMCHKRTPDDALLILEMVPAGKSHFLKAEFYCKDCGTRQLTHFNRVRQCAIEGGVDHLGPCLEKKQREEEHGKGDEDEG